jgi:hypothetical protein
MTNSELYFKNTASIPVNNMKVASDPYPHLRDADGCILARDYINVGKMKYVLECVYTHEKLRSALETIASIEGDYGSGQIANKALEPFQPPANFKYECEPQ